MLAANLLQGLENDIHNMPNTPEKLAGRMALLAHNIRGLVIATFEDGSASSDLQNLYETFKQELLPDLAIDDFADMYAQTIVYGLFAAYYNHNALAGQREADKSAVGAVNRPLRDFPVTSPLLQSLFATMTEPQIENEPFNYLIDELRDLLTGTLIDSQPGVPGQHSRQQDFLIHFYETFLEQYNPGLRGKRGVYYTPQPVVSYIVRSIDYLLRSHFSRRDGLTGTSPLQDEPRFLLLDPACGTGTFLSTVIDYVREYYRQKGNSEMWLKYVHDCLLPSICGYELLMAPYAIAHLVLSRQLAALDLPETERGSWGYQFANGEYLNIYLANALEEAAYEHGMFPGRCKHPHPATPTTPAPTGHEVASKSPIMVVLGNPPFAGHSVNRGEWIASLLDVYKDGCPELKKPAQAKWLSDDYVKFIRLAQWHVEQMGRGIVAFVTNHSYLDNPTFRGMRRSLLQTFDDIYILDLHGNSKKKERAPDGSKDENVFAIQQGIAIGIFVKWQEAKTESHAVVHHADLWGLREVYKQDAEGQQVLVGGKYSWLAEHDLASTDWTILDQLGDQDDHEQGDRKGGPYPPMLERQGDCEDQPYPRMETGQDDHKGRSYHMFEGRQGDHKGGPYPRTEAGQAEHDGGLYPMMEGGQGDPCGGPYPTTEESLYLRTETGQGDRKGRPYPTTTEESLYLFAPQDTRYLAEYEEGWSIPAIFQLSGDPAPGIITCHDDFAIAWSRAEAMQKVERLLGTETEEEARQLFRLCSQDQWQYADAKKELAHDNWHQDLVEILYRPFDKRWTVFNRYVAVHRRERVMRHMLAGENVGLTIGRAGQVIHQDQWDIVFCTRNITEFNLFRRGGNNLFPLYLYSRSGARTANLAPEFISELASSLAMIWLSEGRGDLTRTFGPEDIFAYIYAVLHSPTYRRRYAQFLRRDFPRVPLTSNASLFRTLCSLGCRLVSLHLLEQDAMPVATYPIGGNNSVETVRYDDHRSKVSHASGRIWINSTQYFAQVPSETWAFSLGGYQVCLKWLKDRRGRKLSDDELTHYLHIIAALAETNDVMREIDEVIENQSGYFASRRFDHSADWNV